MKKLRKDYLKHGCKTCIHDESGYCSINEGSDCYNNNYKSWKRKNTERDELIDLIRRCEKTI